MTLYRYVRNKDELVSLMSDTIMGGVLVLDRELAKDWRTALTQVATRTRAVFRPPPLDHRSLRRWLARA
jgi:hypothetical protein